MGNKGLGCHAQSQLPQGPTIIINMMYGCWDMEWDRHNFLSFWAIFSPFIPITICKIISQMCSINDNHMMLDSWDRECSRQFFVILDCFCPLTTQKIKILKKWNRCLEILSFYTCIPKMTIVWCMVPEIWSMTDRIFCHFGWFFAFLPSKNSENQNFEKIKKCLEILSFGARVPKIMVTWWMVPEIWCTTDRKKYKQTDKWIDRWKKWHIKVGAPPKNQEVYNIKKANINKFLTALWHFLENSLLDIIKKLPNITISWSLEFKLFL